MNLKDKVAAQSGMYQDLEDREIWIYGVKVHHDPRASEEDMKKIRERINEIMLEEGFGEYMARIVEASGILGN